MEKDELAEGTDLRSLCVPQKGSLARNNLDQGLFLVVNSTAGVVFFCFCFDCPALFSQLHQLLVLGKSRVKQNSC